jgi:hypothetical protein
MQQRLAAGATATRNIICRWVGRVEAAPQRRLGEELKGVGDCS